jgi:Ca2+-binding RTX toxin-like protein
MVLIQTEDPSFILSGYEVEANPDADGGSLISLFPSMATEGTATYTFDNPAGLYNIRIGYFDEQDGESILNVLVDGTTVGTVLFDQALGGGGAANAANATEALIENVVIGRDATFVLEGFAETAEWARVDFVEFIPVATGTLSFAESTYSVAEGDASIDITVTRTDGTDGEVSATLDVTGGTATEGADFTLGSTTVVFAAGETEKTVSVAIADDALVEGAETVNFSLTPVDNSFLGTQSSTVLTIADNDFDDDNPVTPPPNPVTPPPNPVTPPPNNGGGNDDDGPTIINIIRGTNRSEVLIGSVDGDRIVGRNGSDVIIGGDGDDILIGGGFGDTLRGGAGDDVIRGGKGTDLLKGASGDDLIIGGAAADIMRGGSGNDIHRGGGGNDIARGGGGDDVGRGGGGNDILVGAAGDDLLVGGNGDDTLIGGSGDDVLIGGRGEDIMIGGSGADLFVVDGKGIDTVQDFKLDQDKIRLAGNLEFSSLTITQAGTSTLLSTSETDVALLINVDSMQLTSASFV